jgi:predicted RNA-binding Zn-ribbon protein involved in translation (DUF1610 family)
MALLISDIIVIIAKYGIYLEREMNTRRTSKKPGQLIHESFTACPNCGYVSIGRARSGEPLACPNCGKVCMKCGKQIPAEYYACPECEKKCVQCGKPVTDRFTVCPNCGKRLFGRQAVINTAQWIILGGIVAGAVVSFLITK